MKNSVETITVRLSPQTETLGPPLHIAVGQVRERIHAVSTAYSVERIKVTSDPNDEYLLHLEVAPSSERDPRGIEEIKNNLRKNISVQGVTVE